ncbi:MAG: hypothetical protein HY423_10470, partial [Candidatus Lambdaproteobacteria bacterium]|nr:hypothetical protein [Candidatus Lambdaproteobacteria bacterium]
MGIASGSVLRQIRSAAMTLAVAALTLGFAGPARAENDQTVVLGAGIG